MFIASLLALLLLCLTTLGSDQGDKSSIEQLPIREQCCPAAALSLPPQTQLPRRMAFIVGAQKAGAQTACVVSLLGSTLR